MLAPYNSYQIDVFALAELDKIGWPGARDDSTWSLFVFQAREFLEAWFQTVGAARGSEAHLIVVRDGEGEPLLYLPLCLEMRRGVRVLCFPDGGVSDYNAPILRPGLRLEPAVFRKIWKEILAALPPVDLVYLNNMPDRVVETPNPFLALGLGAPQGRGSYIDLSGSWTAYSAEPARHAAIGQAARKLRKLARKHAIRFLTAPLSQPSRETWVDFILDQKRRQYLRTMGKDVNALPGYETFFRHMAASEQLDRVSTLHCLMVGDEIAAGHLGYATAKRAYYILTVTNYDLFAKDSVGTALFSHLLQQAFADGLSVLDLGIGAEPYKDLWVTGHYSLYSYVQPLTLRGRIAAGALMLKYSPALKRLRQLRASPGLVPC